VQRVQRNIYLQRQNHISNSSQPFHVDAERITGVASRPTCEHDTPAETRELKGFQSERDNVFPSRSLPRIDVIPIETLLIMQRERLFRCIEWVLQHHSAATAAAAAAAVANKSAGVQPILNAWIAQEVRTKSRRPLIYRLRSWTLWKLCRLT